MLTHGGRLNHYARQYGIPAEDWLDLSTGISPFAYPCPPVPADSWHRLPEEDDGLLATATRYYGCGSLLAVAGSQAAIMALPGVVARHRQQTGLVALPRVGYKEHQHAWQSYDGGSGSWQVELYDGHPDEDLLSRADVVVLINPNNPSGLLVDNGFLTMMRQQLAARGALLIVDEAFMDCTPEQSLLNTPLGDELIVLRSLGKFFGLAGARVGFVVATPYWLTALNEALGPWTLSGPSRQVAAMALADVEWHAQARQRIAIASSRLADVLARYLGSQVSGSGLFQRVRIEHAPTVHRLLCQQGILARLCDEKDALRFGLPGDELAWQRLTNALQGLDRGVIQCN